MARRTNQDEIVRLEARRDSLESKISEAESYKTLESAGNHGSRTEFTDPTKLNSMLERVNNKLHNLYIQEGV